MLKASEWNSILAHPLNHAAASAAVEGHAKEVLSQLSPSAILTTNELADKLYPPHHMVGQSGIDARKAIFRILMAGAKLGLSDCATKAQTGKVLMGRLSFPWQWHAPRAKPAVPAGGEVDALVAQNASEVRKLLSAVFPKLEPLTAALTALVPLLAVMAQQEFMCPHCGAFHSPHANLEEGK